MSLSKEDIYKMVEKDFSEISALASFKEDAAAEVQEHYNAVTDMAYEYYQVALVGKYVTNHVMFQLTLFIKRCNKLFLNASIAGITHTIAGIQKEVDSKEKE